MASTPVDSRMQIVQTEQPPAGPVDAQPSAFPLDKMEVESVPPPVIETETKEDMVQEEKRGGILLPAIAAIAILLLLAGGGYCVAKRR